MDLNSTILFAALLGLQTVGAATITVTNTADSGPGTLRAALFSATDGDTIDFAMLTPARITLTSGELVVSSGLTIRGPGPSRLLVDGSHQSRIFHVVASNAVVTISGLTLTNGYTSSWNTLGGGLNNPAARLTISNCVLAGNNAIEGGAVFNEGQLQIISSTVKDNTASNGGGGLLNSKGTVLITNCTFTGNSSPVGGAIHNLSAPSTSTVRVVSSILSGNFATLGGGIANSAWGGTATLVVVQSTVSRNTMPLFGGYGGGIANRATEMVGSRANAAIIDSTIEGNVTDEGGGIHNSSGQGSAYLGITNSTISGNTAHCRGPFGNECGGHGIFNGTFAQANGGGTGSVYVVNSTFANNISSNGGSALYAFSLVPENLKRLNLVIASSLFDSGRSDVAIFDLGSSIVTSVGYNLCSDSGSGFLTNSTDQINTDARVGPLRDHGGPTFTHALLPGSPAIDKGRNFSGSTTDQRGFARTVNIAGIPNAADGTDIGAVESQDAGLSLVNFGVVSNRFGFNLIGPFGSVLVEASTDLSNWTALATNTITDEPLRFIGPAVEPSRHFYRARPY